MNNRSNSNRGYYESNVKDNNTQNKYLTSNNNNRNKIRYYNVIIIIVMGITMLVNAAGKCKDIYVITIIFDHNLRVITCTRCNQNDQEISNYFKKRNSRNNNNRNSKTSTV